MTVAAAPTLVQAVTAEVAPIGQCNGKGGGGEGGAPPAGGAVRGAGARGAPAPSPPAPGAGTGHHLPVGDGAGEDGDEGGAGGAEQRSGAGQWCRTRRRRQGQAGERSEATRATGEGTGEGGTPRSRRQGTGGDGVTRQGAGEGEWPWVHWLAGVHREGNGMMGRCSPASRPTNRPTIPAAAIPGDGDGVPAPADVPGHAATGAHAAAPAGRCNSVGGAGGKGEEHRRAWERLGEAERSLREREARVKGEVGGAEEGRTEGSDRPQGGEAQAVEEQQMTWADLLRGQEGVARAEREGGRRGEGRGRDDTPLVPFRQPAIPPEQEGEMQERAWRRISGEAARLADRDREVAAPERRVRKEEEAVARGAHRVLPDPEGDTPYTDVEGRSPSGKRAREEDEKAGQERGKRRRGEERGAGEAEGAPRPASPSPEPTPTDWDSESPPPRQYAPPPVRRGPGTVAGWTEGGMAELARYVKWAGKTRGRREKRGPRPLSDLVGRAGRPRERGPEMDEGRERRMLGAALPGLRLDCPQEKGKKPWVQILRELLQREGRYGGDA